MKAVGADGDLDGDREVGLDPKRDRFKLTHQRHGLGQLVRPVGEVVRYFIGKLEGQARRRTAIGPRTRLQGVGSDGCRFVTPGVLERCRAGRTVERLAEDVFRGDRGYEQGGEDKRQN